MAKKLKGSIPASTKSEYATFLDEGASIEGKFSFSGAVLLNGRLQGEIVSNDTLVIGDKGVVNANIRAGTVQIAGEVVGNVSATERVQLGGRSRVVGNVDAPIVIIEDGAVIEGQCSMSKAAPGDGSPAAPHDASIVPLRRSDAT